MRHLKGKNFVQERELVLLTTSFVQTLIAEIQRLLNARPLTLIYDDSEFISFPLSPPHLVYERRLANSPSGQYFELISTNTLFVRKLRSWRTEYPQSVRGNSYVSVNQQAEFAVGSIVIVQNDKTKRNFWKLAKVEKLLLGADGVVRAAVVKSG